MHERICGQLKYSYAHNTYDNFRYNNLVSRDKVAHSVFARGKDSSGLKRWCWVRIDEKENMIIRVILLTDPTSRFRFRGKSASTLLKPNRKIFQPNFRMLVTSVRWIGRLDRSKGWNCSYDECKWVHKSRQHQQNIWLKEAVAHLFQKCYLYSPSISQIRSNRRGYSELE